MKILEKLADLADKLDASGYIDEAGQVDVLLKDADFLDWFKGKKPKCTCSCEGCKYAKQGAGMGMKKVLDHHCGGQNAKPGEACEFK